jgi:hypothetical protein
MSRKHIRGMDVNIYIYHTLAIAEVIDQLYILVVLVHRIRSLVYTEYDDVRAQQLFWT